MTGLGGNRLSAVKWEVAPRQRQVAGLLLFIYTQRNMDFVGIANVFVKISKPPNRISRRRKGIYSQIGFNFFGELFYTPYPPLIQLVGRAPLLREGRGGFLAPQVL